MVLEFEDKGATLLDIQMGEWQWLGVINRSGENLIGTDNGVVKCRTIKRKAGSAQK